jgi:glycerol-3-phosphate acyltransferase PlsX
LKDQLTISVDAMGGDTGASVVVGGARLSRIRHPDVHFLMHGDENILRPLIDQDAELAAVCSIDHAPDAIAMDAKPSQAIRSGRKTSMWRAINSVRDGEAQVAISAGNTGALMAMSTIQLRTIKGVDRPAIAALWPTMRGETVVLDVGATVTADERQLVTFAIMGEAFARAVFGLKRPTVGLLNIGTEELKGNEAVRAAAQTLRDADLPIEFRGFVEGDDISTGVVDVVVTDGFTGNVALKTAEGTAKLISHYLSSAIRRSITSRIGYFFAAGAFRTLREKMDPRAVNGGVFLGLNGVVVKSHGGTDEKGFASAIDLAVDMAANELPQQIASDVSHVFAVDGDDQALQDTVKEDNQQAAAT